MAAISELSEDLAELRELEKQEYAMATSYRALAAQLASALASCLTETAYVRAMILGIGGDLAYRHEVTATKVLDAARKAGVI